MCGLSPASMYNDGITNGCLQCASPADSKKGSTSCDVCEVRLLISHASFFRFNFLIRCPYTRLMIGHTLSLTHTYSHTARPHTHIYRRITTGTTTTTSALPVPPPPPTARQAPPSAPSSLKPATGDTRHPSSRSIPVPLALMLAEAETPQVSSTHAHVHIHTHTHAHKYTYKYTYSRVVVYRHSNCLFTCILRILLQVPFLWSILQYVREPIPPAPPLINPRY